MSLSLGEMSVVPSRLVMPDSAVPPRSDPAVTRVAALVTAIDPLDDVEVRHREESLAWLRSTNDVFRRARPATPSPHLVSYVVLVDRRDGAVLLADHRAAGLWLPIGGHVEPGEDPTETAVREVMEELGVRARFAGATGRRPVFITRTTTRGADPHVDVSLWFVFGGEREQLLRPDPGEFRSVRWWSRAELGAADPTSFDPHLHRMLAKLDAG
jgi:8-oxo-dGTP diphosphatase